MPQVLLKLMHVGKHTKMFGMTPARLPRSIRQLGASRSLCCIDGVGHRIPWSGIRGDPDRDSERVLGKYQSISGGYVFEHHNFWYAQSAFETIGLWKSLETFEMTNA